MKKNFILLLSTIMTFLVSCSTSSSVTEDIEKPTTVESPCTVVLNVDDPEIFNIQLNANTNVHYYGTKNEDGIPTAFQQILVDDAVDGKTIIDIDENYRPTKIITYTGVVYELIWNDDKTGVINAYDPASNVTVCASFDTSTEMGISDKMFSKSRSTNIEGRSGEPILTITPISDNLSSKALYTRSAYENNQKVLVTFEKCEDYFDPHSVYLALKSGKGDWIGELHSYDKISTGKYMFHIPSDKYPAIDPEAIVNKINDIFSAVGFVSQCLVATGGDYVLCASVAAGLSLLTEGAFIAAAPGFTAGCTAAIKGLAAASFINGGYGLISGVPDLGANDTPTLTNAFIKWMKDCNFLKRIYTDNLVIGPVVNGLAGPYPDITMTPEDESKVIPIVEEGSPMIQRFYLDPSSPVAGQGYNAYAVLHCMTYNSKVRMSIEGTDGYKKSIEETITSPNSIVTMYVPGSYSGVYDAVQVEVVDADGNYVSSANASLVFQ